MRGMMLAIAVLVLSACVQTGSDDDAKLSAEKWVRATLKDPDSAKFSGLYVVRVPGKDKIGGQTLYTCGWVNARNGFGGYTGDSRFVVQHTFYDGSPKTFSTIYAWYEEGLLRKLDPTSAPDKPASGFETLYWNKQCVDAAHPPSYTAKT